MKRKAFAVFLISFLMLSMGYVLWGNKSVPSSPKQEKLKLYIEYPSRVEEKIIHGAFPHFSTNYSVVANITVITLNHHLKVSWNFVIKNRTRNSTVIYIKSPSFGKLSMTLEGKQVNVSKLSRYSLPQYYAQVISLNVTYPKDIPIHGTGV